MPDHSLEVVAISGIGTVSTAFCLMLQALSLALAMLVMSNSTAGTLVLAATGKHSAIVCECADGWNCGRVSGSLGWGTLTSNTERVWA